MDVGRRLDGEAVVSAARRNGAETVRGRGPSGLEVARVPGSNKRSSVNSGGPCQFGTNSQRRVVQRGSSRR